MDEANGNGRPISAKDMSRLQLDMLEKMYQGQSALQKEISDFKEEIIKEITALKTERKTEKNMENTYENKKNRWFVAAGIAGSLALGISNSITH